ncbi:MAG: DUF2155 domain-containing protein [Hyphomicrobiales bacterium]|nr:DUF2155 domain-containing protein [Hyphomicrobiales bacterium]
MVPLILRAALVMGVVTCGASAALAQFGFLFGDPPPRPPGDVGRPPLLQPPRQYPPPPQYPPQSQPAPQTRPAPPTVPIARPPRQPTEIPPPPPDDEVVEGPPAQRVVHPVAVFSGLDKITGRIINFPVEIGETVQFGALQLTTRACYTRPPTETANTDAFVEVDEVTLQGEVKRIFTGWVFASSPGLHAIEHPIYDVWLTDCRGGTQVVAAEGAPPPEPPRPQPKAQPKQKQVQQQPKRPPPQVAPPPPPPPPPQQPSIFPLFR